VRHDVFLITLSMNASRSSPSGNLPIRRVSSFDLVMSLHFYLKINLAKKRAFREELSLSRIVLIFQKCIRLEKSREFIYNFFTIVFLDGRIFQFLKEHVILH